MAQHRAPRYLLAFVLCSFSWSITAAATLSSKPRRIKVPETVTRDLDDEDRNCVVSDGGINKHVQAELISLAAKNSREVLVRGSGLCLCGAQNCGFWIYRRLAGRYELLLKGIGANKVMRGRTLANGYRDVIAQSHASAIQTIVRTYRFDGRKYLLHRCVSRDYFDEQGNELKKPRLTPCQ
jgi:hypothetical protein